MADVNEGGNFIIDPLSRRVGALSYSGVILGAFYGGGSCLSTLVIDQTPRLYRVYFHK